MNPMAGKQLGGAAAAALEDNSPDGKAVAPRSAMDATIAERTDRRIPVIVFRQ